MEKVMKLKVEGIMCTGCVEDMQIVLKNTAGIHDASVSFSDGTVSVTFDPEVIDAREVFKKVAKLGFKTTLAEEGQ